MQNNKTVNYDKVSKIADELKLKGIKPSITDICDSLGLLSINSKVTEYLEKWYHSQPEFRRVKQAPLTEHIQMESKLDQEKTTDLEKSLSLLRATLESTADGIMMVNGKGQVVDWNQKFIEMWRIPSHMLESGIERIGFEYILSQLTNPQTVISDVQYLYENPEWQGELPVLHFKDGRIFERFTQPQKIGDEIVGRVYSFRDVTQKRIADDALRIRERAIESSIHGVAIIDITKKEQPIIYVNKAFEKMTGYASTDAVGMDIYKIFVMNMDKINQKRIELAIKECHEETIELESTRKNNESYWCELSIAPVKDSFEEVRHFVCIVNDITDRREMERQLIRQATHDSLTELPNRVLLIDRVEQAILQAKKKKNMVAFLFLDLDKFKLTNDTLGHSMGDKLLQSVANRLLIATNDFDTVARLGGDEFVVLLPDISHEDQAITIVSDILQLLDKSFQIEQHTLNITGSIGVSFYPKDGTDYESLMKSADLSMYHAKDSGRNTFKVYDPEMNQRVINHMQLDNALREAMDRKEFYIVYQPLIDLKEDRIIGAEALLRWNSHFLGEVSPMQFIGFAEENGLILEIGEWVLRQSCMQLVKWHKQGLDNLSMAVNISGKQFKGGKLPELVQKILEETGLAPQFLELELTESLLVDDVEMAVRTMYALKDMGVKIVIDDFGTGYSSLSYLKQFPVDKLKIDRSFVNESMENENEAAIARAVINLGHTLNLKVLAEGIETEIQSKFMKDHDCDFAQGYFYLKPAREDAFIVYYDSFNSK